MHTKTNPTRLLNSQPPLHYLVATTTHQKIKDPQPFPASTSTHHISSIFQTKIMHVIHIYIYIFYNLQTILLTKYPDYYVGLYLYIIFFHNVFVYNQMKTTNVFYFILFSIHITVVLPPFFKECHFSFFSCYIKNIVFDFQCNF